MKVSLGWCKELLDDTEATRALDAATAARALTMVGLEVESVVERGRELAGILVAEVLGVRPHPGADKLRLVRVRAGAREEEVVCGAPNVPPAGHHVVWAAPGARLPGGRTLEAREVRGVMSPGMLCSEPELGLGEKGEGILLLGKDAPGGADFTVAYGVADSVFEVNVTPNRPDALSHLGIARELGAALGIPLRPPARLGVLEAAAAVRDVVIEDEGACPRYRASLVTGVTVGESPLGMRLRLAACGIRAISNLVDVTNYVLLELGHPLHAFDLDKVAGAIRVRRAKPGEVLTTLDGVDRALVPGDVVIADDRGAIALAGVMGGATTEVTGQTRNVLLEAATFDPVSVRRTSKRLGLLSEASYRFERGVDAEGVTLASQRASDLIASLGGGAVSPSVVDRYPRPPVRRRIVLPVARLERVSGLAITSSEAVRELKKIADDVAVVSSGDDGPAIALSAPTYRPDLSLPEDLIEEVLRLGGRYEAPAAVERVLANAVSAPSPEGPSDRARDLLAAAGLSEIVSWGFVPRAALESIAAQASGAVRARLADGVVVKNPISADYEVMRTSLLPGLGAALARNLSRGLADVRLFEVGPVVYKGAAAEAEPAQREQAALLVAGRAGGWLRPGEPLDFHDLKRVVEAVLRGFGAEARYVARRDLPFLHPGVAAEIVLAGGQSAGIAGELDPRVARKMGIETRALYAELDVALLGAARAVPRGQAPPRFPASTRDLSFWIDAAVPAADQRDAFVAANEPLLVDVAVLEDFRDPKYVPAGKKGMLWTMTYRADDRTLTDAEADAAHARVVAALSAKLAIQIR